MEKHLQLKSFQQDNGLGVSRILEAIFTDIPMANGKTEAQCPEQAVRMMLVKVPGISIYQEDAVSCSET